jgi:hypothetical protein
MDAQGNVSQAQTSLIGDNLGNHTATQNLKMNNNWISNDGSGKGVKISDNGDVYISGKLGVGIASPQANIHVCSGESYSADMFVGNNPYQNEGLAFLNTADAAHEWVRGEICHGYASNASGWQITSPNNYGGIRFANRGIAFIAGSADNQTLQTPMWIDNSGKVGIGTVSPSEKLHIFQATADPSFTKIENTAGTLNLGVDGVHAIINSSQDLMLNWYSNTNVIVGGEQSGNFSTLHNTYLGTANGNVVVGGNQSGDLEARYNTYLATQSGKVGIGTTNPITKLDVEGNGYFKDNVGIGTQDISSAKLHVSNNGGTALLVESSSIGIKFNANDAENKAFNIQRNNADELTIWGDGRVWARKVKVRQGSWSDFVFKPDYILPDMNTLKSYIEVHHHLPGIPSEDEVKANGIDLGEMNAKLLQKIEELTLYMLKQQNEIDALKKQMQTNSK